MPVSRVRVRPPHSHGGLLAFAALLGALMAIPVASYTWLWFLLPGFLRFFGYNFWIINSIQAAIALVPFLIFLLWLPRQCQHARWVAAAGATYALSVVLFSMLGIDLYLPWAAWVALLEYLLLVPIAVAIGAALALLSMLVQRHLFHRLIEQDGTLCNHCAYPVGRSRSTTCPECGNEVSSISPTRSERMIALMHRRRRGIAVTLLAVLVPGYALVSWTEYDHRTLGRSFSEEPWAQSMSFDFLQFGSTTTIAYAPLDAARGDEMALADTVIVIELVRQPVWKRHDVRIRLGHVAGTQRRRVDEVVPGNPIVLCDVPAGRGRQILRHGPPPELVERLVAAAVEAGWDPEDQWWTVTDVIEVAWDDSK